MSLRRMALFSRALLMVKGRVMKRLFLFAAAFGCLIACDESTSPDAGTQLRADATLPADSGQQQAEAGTDAGPADLGVSDSGDMADAGAPDSGGFVPPAYGQWIKYEPPGAVCANGSQYKIFVRFSQTSSSVVVAFEGGGACWDYASCTGTGIRSAANRDGIPDEHATAHADVGGFAIPVDFVYPMLNNRPEVTPTADWNQVFLPYCTGDVYSGDRVVTYEDPNMQQPSIEFHHVGHRNILASIDMLREMFPNIPRLFVTGCSAGGAGALINYHFLRSGLNVDRGYLLDDSGPLFPDTASTSRSRPLHDRVRQSWGSDSLIAASPRPGEISADFGALPRVLSEEWPDDRLALTQFRLDYNYSLYSYERFYTRAKNGDIVIFGDGSGLGGLGLDENVAADRAAVYSLWWDDTALLTDQFDRHDNLGYFMPFYRTTNSSHCVTIPGFEEFSENELLDLFLNDFPRLAWAGSELETRSGQTLNIRGYLDQLLDDAQPLQSWFEETTEGPFVPCTPGNYDQAGCEAAQ